jgi:hypothetical protein
VLAAEEKISLGIAALWSLVLAPKIDPLCKFDFNKYAYI